MARSRPTLPFTPLRILRADQVERGPQHPPEKLVTLLDSSTWELLVRDWAESLSSIYHSVERIGGAGDEGRDVLGYLGDPKKSPPWDNFQCKFYNDRLAPAQIWCEIGKLCHYTFEGAYTVPRAYHFVAPRDVGTKLFKLLEKPDRLRDGLIDNWDEHCRADITQRRSIPLTGAFKKYVQKFDFSIFGYLPVRKMIEQLRGTPHYVRYFGGGLPDRPPDQLPPATVAAHETRYVRHLLDAYGDCLSCSFSDASALVTNGVHRGHFDRSREDFYRAESLRVFSRATVPDGTFEALQEEIYRGVVDVAESDYTDGFECVKATAKAARDLQLQANALISVLSSPDRNGVCHQLANADKLVWVKH